MGKDISIDKNLSEKKECVQFTGKSLQLLSPNSHGGFSRFHEPSWNFASEDFSLTVQFKTSFRGSWKRLVTKRGPVATQWYSLALCSGIPRLELSPAVNIIGTVNCTDGKWHQVTSTRAGNIFTLYIDGVYSHSQKVDIRLYNEGEFAIGYWETEEYDGSNFVGEIKNVAIFAKCLSKEEVEDYFKNFSSTLV